MVREDIIDKAEMFAQEKHKDQLDDSGKPYFNHCAQVADIVSLVTNDPDIIAAAYLHDTLEDTKTTYEELVQEFSEKVANLVREVTHEGTKDNVGYYFPNLKTKDGILIKFADRLSNLSRMEGVWDIARQEHYLGKSKFWKSHPKEESRKHLFHILQRIIKSTPHSMCHDAEAWAMAEQITKG